MLYGERVVKLFHDRFVHCVHVVIIRTVHRIVMVVHTYPLPRPNPFIVVGYEIL